MLILDLMPLLLLLLLGEINEFKDVLSYLLIQISSHLMIKLLVKLIQTAFQAIKLAVYNKYSYILFEGDYKGILRLCKTSTCRLLGSLHYFSQMSQLFLVLSFVWFFLLFLGMLISFPTTQLVRLFLYLELSHFHLFSSPLGFFFFFAID